MAPLDSSTPLHTMSYWNALIVRGSFVLSASSQRFRRRRSKENRVALLRARRFDEPDARFLGEKLCNRPFGLLGQHEVRDARQSQRLARLDRLVEEAAR